MSTDLNKEQLEACNHFDGPLLVLAGAGTGKTKVLTNRIANLIINKKAFASQILAVTFTNKAANEMKDRIFKILGEEIPGMYIGTFHSLSARILRKLAHFIGLGSDFTIIDLDDQLRLVKRIMADLKLDQEKINPKMVIAKISSWKDKALKPSDVSDEPHNPFINGCYQIYPIYQDELKRSNSCDFGDLILHVITILSKNPEIQSHYNNKFKYILVDEYQDTNTAQYLWLRLLVQGHNNICCVGDDDQSVYSFRGAEIENILRFEQDFQDAHIIKLQQNYRSTEHILNSASELISYNSSRHDKKLFTEMSGGNKVKIIANWDDLAEANVIAEEVENLVLKQYPKNEIAILVRAFFQTRNFEEVFLNRAIPYKIVGGLRFYERKEIKDIIAYLRLIQSPSDFLACERIINVPKRNIGSATFAKINQISKSENKNILEAIEIYMGSLSPTSKAYNQIEIFYKLIKRAISYKEKYDLVELTKFIVTESGYENMLKDDKKNDNTSKLENIREFYSALSEFETLEQFLEHISLVNEKQDSEAGESINIITLHSAKGLEFKTVFLTGWEEGIFPHQRSIDESGKKGLEEERRLAYVGITRAKENLYISYASNRRMYNKWQSSNPSRFLEELPKESLEFQNNGGVNFGHNNYNKNNQYNRDLNKPKVSFKVNDPVIHKIMGECKVKSIIGDVVEVVSDSGKTRFVTASTLRAA